jgi:hypothetical protein
MTKQRNNDAKARADAVFRKPKPRPPIPAMRKQACQPPTSLPLFAVSWLQALTVIVLTAMIALMLAYAGL